ncbi:MAG: ChaN family lipoprotein [Thermodesulfovibrionales bacterium]
MSGIFPGLMTRLICGCRTAAVGVFLSVILFQICFLSGACTEQKNVFRTSDRQPITYEQMLDDLKNVRVVFVGEVHDREAHHQLQLDAIKALNDRKVPLSVGFEMFTYESQNDLDKWTEGSLPVDTFIPIYYKNWSYPWTLYDDILFYIRDNKIPAIGLNVPAEITQKVSVSGFASLTQEELKKLPPDVGCTVNEQYMQFIRKAYAMHGHGGKQFQFFCEAQLLWNQTMAHNIIAFLKKNPAKKIVVLTGNGHAWKKGIPEQVRTISEETQYRVILPQIPGYVDPQSVTAGDADYILLQ